MICYSPVSSAAFTRDVRLTGCVCVCVCVQLHFWRNSHV